MQTEKITKKLFFCEKEMACFCRLKRQYRDFSPDCPAGDAAGAESFYREIKKMLAENREWVHFGLEWEDQYILRHCELL